MKRLCGILSKLAALLVFTALFCPGSLAATFDWLPNPSGTYPINQSSLFQLDLNVTVNESLVLFTYQETTLSNLTVSSSTGLITVVASNDEIGYYIHTFMAKNRSNEFDAVYAEIAFNISNVNDPPNITQVYPANSTPSTTENISIGFGFNYTASDPDIKWGDYLVSSWYLDSVLVYNQTNETSGNWTYYPGFCNSGNHNVTLITRDTGGLTDYRTWNVTVNNVNRPPEFSLAIQGATWDEDNVLLNNITLSNHFFDPDNLECNNSANKDILAYRVRGNSSISFSINDTSSNVSLYPSGNWSGSEIVYFYVNDTINLTVSNNVTFTVNNVNDPPRISPIANQTAAVNVTFSLQVQVTDPDMAYGDALTYSDNSTLFDINQSTGVIQFTPNSSSIGNYTINISVVDSAGAGDWIIMYLEVRSNSAPTLNPIGTLTAVQDTLFQYDITGYDPDLDSLTFSSNSSLFTIQSLNQSAGSISFTPANSQVNNYSINFTVTDINGAVDSELVTFIVSNVNDAPTLSPIAAKNGKVNQTFVMGVYAYDIDFDTPYGDNLTFSSNATFFNITKLNATYAIINFTPSLSDVGNYSVMITVNDTGALYYTEIFSFVIAATTAPTLLPIGNQTLIEDSLFTLDIYAYDINGDNLSFYINVTGLNYTQFNITRLNDTQAVLQFTPVIYDVGNYTIRFSVNDTDNLSSYQDVNFIVLARNDPPILEEIGNLTATQDIRFTRYVNAYDEEGANLTFYVNGSLFNITYFNMSAGLINFTPANDAVGSYLLNISVSDGVNYDYEVINFTILNVNDPPNITSAIPLTDTSAAENSSLVFNVTANDPDLRFGDNLSFEFHVDRVNQTSGLSSPALQGNNLSITFTYAPGFCAAGSHNITAIVKDSNNASSRRYWNITVNNTNRPPIFGLKFITTEGQFSNGSLTRINASSSPGNLTLAKQNAIDYYSNGSYLSHSIDFGSDSLRHNLTYISWHSFAPNGTNVTLFTRTSFDGLVWENWSMPYTESGSEINSSPGRYLQVMANLSTNSTLASPIIYDIEVRFILANFSFGQNTNINPWIDLDNFFYDPDFTECSDANKDTLNFTIRGSSQIGMSLQTGNSVRLVPNSFLGSETVWFLLNDSLAVVESNNATLTTTYEVASGGGSTVVYIERGGSSTTVIKTRITLKNITEPIVLNILMPGAVTMYMNDTLVAPIKIQNSGNKTLNKISLRAETNNSNLSYAFSKSVIDILRPGESVNSDLTIRSYRTLGAYDIVIIADVADPKYTDSAKLLVNSIEKGEQNKSMVNTKIAFTRDLLESNAECLELYELVAEAEAAINAGKYAEASDTLTKAADACKYLISKREEPIKIEKPLSTTDSILELLKRRNVQFMLISAGGMLIAAILFIVLLERSRSRGKKKK